MELARGIAHVSFTGGGVFLPARDAYDRQTLIEHVIARAHAQGRVQVLLDRHRWLVQAGAPQFGRTCAVCGQVADTAGCCATSDGVTYCVCCALGGQQRIEQLHHEEWRQVG